MYVYFKEIQYEGKPLLWKVDEKNNKATCTYQCHQEKEKKLDSAKVNVVLGPVKGIEVKDSGAEIADYSRFQKQYHPYQANELKRTTSVSQVPLSMFTPTRPVLSRTISTPHYSPPPKTEAIEEHKKSSLFETITEHFSGETTCYFRLAEKNKQTIDSLSKYGVLTRATISICEQMLKDEELYPFRIQQLNLLKNFFDQYLEPALSGLGPETLHQVKPYLLNAILQALRNIPFNNQPTWFDVPAPILPPSSEMVLEKAYEQKLLTANLMLMPLEFFTDAALSAKELANGNDQLAKCLNTLKKSLAPHRKELSRLLLTLKLLTMCCGIITYKHSMIRAEDCGECYGYNMKTLSAALASLKSPHALLRFILDKFKEEDIHHDIVEKILQEQQESRGQLILNNTYYSLSTLINEALTKIYHSEKLKPGVLVNIKTKLTASVIAELDQIIRGNRFCAEAKYVSPSISKMHEDVYLRQDWMEELTECLSPITSEKKKPSSVHEKTNRKLKEAISSFFSEKISVLIAREKSEEEQSSSGMHFSK